MEEILALQKELMEIQEEAVEHRLSERNIVEIIEKIKKKNEDLQLLHTTNGKEYLTQNKLIKEILSEMNESSGELRIGELPNLLRVSTESINSAIDYLVKKKDKSHMQGLPVFVISGRLINMTYLDIITNEINEMLKLNGQVYISQLTQNFGLPIDFLRDEICRRIGRDGGIMAQIETDILYTQAYSNRQKLKIRGLLRAATRPISINFISTKYKIMEWFISKAIEELISTNELQGKTEGGIYTPSSFSDRQEHIVRSFFNQNSYIEYYMLNKIQINRGAKEFISSLKLPAINLNTVAVSKTLGSQLESALKQTIRDEGWMDLYMCLPLQIPLNEIAILITKLGKFALEQGVIQDTYFISNEFLDKCLKKFEQPAEKYANENAVALAQQFKAAGKAKETENLSVRAQKKLGAQNKPKTKGKRKGGKRQIEEEIKEEEENQPHTDLGKFQASFTLEQIEIEISKFEEMEKISEDNEGLFASISICLQDRIKELYTNSCIHYLNTRKSSQMGKQSDSAKMQLEIENCVTEIENIEKSIIKVEKLITVDMDIGKKIIGNIREYIGGQLLLPLANEMLLFHVIHLKKDISWMTSKVNLVSGLKYKFLLSEDKEKAIQKLPTDVRQIYITLTNKAFEKDIPGFISFIYDNKQDIAVSIKILDKKTEKSFLLNKKWANKEIFKKDSEDYPTVLFNCMNQLLLENGIYLLLPNENWAIDAMAMIIGELTKISEGTVKVINKHIQQFNRFITITNKEKQNYTEKEATFYEKFLDTKESKIEELINLFP